MAKPRIKEVIVVEGRYDKNTLLQVVDAAVIETNGFGIFSQKEKVALLRRLATQRGLILLTDSDGAGFVIRNHLKGVLPREGVKQAYIPDVQGKERRKKKGSKAGTLGVEGMRPETLLRVLQNCGASFSDEETKDANITNSIPITKADLMLAGLSGGAGSREKRLALLKKLELPQNLTANGMLEVLNLLVCREEFFNLVQRL